MVKRKRPIYQVGVLLVFFVLFILAVPYHPAGAKTESDISEIRVQKIALIPFLKGFSTTRANEALESRASQTYFNPENISADADQILTRYVHRALKNRFRSKVIPLLDCFKAYDQISRDHLKDTPRMLAVKVGKALGANLVMTGYVWRYKERVGGSYGVESPASVAFAVHLFDVAGGKLLWSTKFEETQKSLSENLLSAKAFLKRKGKWLTANELAQSGVDEIFKKFPLR